MYRIGSKITISIGRRGEKPDFYPATIVSEPTEKRIDGRLVRVADVISAQATLAGDLRLANRLHDLAFAFPARRAADGWVELLDGPKDAPLSVGQLIEK